MWHFLLGIVLFYAAVLADTFGGDMFAIGHINPHWLALATLGWFAFGCENDKLLVVAAVGALEDALTAAPLGAGAAAYLLAAYTLLLLVDWVGCSTVARRGLCLAVSLLVLEALLAALQGILGPVALPPGTALRAPLTAAYTFAVGMPILLAIQGFGPPRDRARDL